MYAAPAIDTAFHAEGNGQFTGDTFHVIGTSPRYKKVLDFTHDSDRTRDVNLWYKDSAS